MFVTSSQGSGVLPIVCDQKFKGLNFRLFSLSKKKDSVADGNSTVSSTPVIRRKAVVRLKDYPDMQAFLGFGGDIETLQQVLWYLPEVAS